LDAPVCIAKETKGWLKNLPRIGVVLQEGLSEVENIEANNLEIINLDPKVNTRFAL